MRYNHHHHYFHFEIGKKDKKESFYLDYLFLFIRILYYPYFIKKKSIDLIHQNVPFDLKGISREFIFNKINRFIKIKTVIHIHGGEYVFKKPTNKILHYLIKNLLNKNDKILVLSDLERNSLAHLYGFYDSIVLPNAIEIQESFLERNFSIVPVFLFFGRIHESKGILELIELFRKLKYDLKFKFLMCGDGPLKEYATKELNDILGDDFTYGGVVSGNLKSEIFLKADYFLLPSRYGEGLPMALLEAMSFGLIPIVSNDGSMEHLIQDSLNGIKVNKNDLEHLYFKILQVTQNDDLKKSISKNAFNTVNELHNINNYIISLNRIYEEDIDV